MRMSHRRRRRVVPLLVFVILAGVGLWHFLPVERISILRPIDLAVPNPWFLNWRLAEIRHDRALCNAVVVAPHVVAFPVSDAVTGAGCGWKNSVRIVSVGGARLAIDKLSCEITAAFGLWMIHEVQIEAVRVFGHRVTEVHHAGGYACRDIDGSPKERSEHATANAIDIKAFTLSNGRRISVAQHWSGDGPEAKFLRLIHARACDYFRVAIGPAYNAAHRDHFHYDRGPSRGCR